MNDDFALEVFATGNSDAVYLVGLIADENQVTKSESNRGVKQALWSLISGIAGASFAAESRHALVWAQKWLEPMAEATAAVGSQRLIHYSPISDDFPH